MFFNNILVCLVTRAGVINSFPNCSQFVVWRTDGDGNCLLHAASLGCFGFQDRRKILRRRLFEYMEKIKNIASFKELYAAEQMKVANQQEPQELQRLLDKECEKLLSNHYLEPVHVFSLANMLRRPVVVYGSATCGVDTKEAIVSVDNDMRGIYLPTVDISQCWFKLPLCLLYETQGNCGGHFSALLAAHGM
jgi:tumor necrosis factor alpha-induced protein 3